MFVAEEAGSRDEAFPTTWTALAEQLERQLGKAHYETWFSQLLCRSFSGERIQLVSQNEFTKDWIQRRFLNDVQSAALRIDGRRRVVQVLHEGEVPRSERVQLSPLGRFVPARAVVSEPDTRRTAAWSGPRRSAAWGESARARIEMQRPSAGMPGATADTGPEHGVSGVGTSGVGASAGRTPSAWGSGEARASRSVPSTLRGMQRRTEGSSAGASETEAPGAGTSESAGGELGKVGRTEPKPIEPGRIKDGAGLSGESPASQPFWLREARESAVPERSGPEPQGSPSEGEDPSARDGGAAEARHGGRSPSDPGGRERVTVNEAPGGADVAEHPLSARSFRDEPRDEPRDEETIAAERGAGALRAELREDASESVLEKGTELLRPREGHTVRPGREAFGDYGGPGGGGGGGDEPPYFFSDFTLNDAFTFDSFVVGDCNELAHASAKAITEFPGRGYNPFFLYGGSGLGKTHLLQAICHAVTRRHARKRIVYLSCESFVNQFIQAITDGELDRFRQRCRQVDLLVIDDIQFLEGKSRTQDEFFHTFNSLFHGDKQIILSCDRPPKEIPTLQERLISRFRWGMVTEVERPRFETRVAIVQRKAEMRRILLAPEVAECIAEHIDNNIRELEGAVTKVLNYAELMHRPIDLTTVRDALRDLVPDTPRVSVQDILECVGKEFRLSAREIQSRKRAKSIVRARQVAMYLSRQLTSLSFEEIGGFFGGRDHTTVMHGFRRMEQAFEEDTEFAQKVERLRMRLQRGG